MNRPSHPNTSIFPTSNIQAPHFRPQTPRHPNPRQFHPKPRTQHPHHRPRHHQNNNRGPRPFKSNPNQQERQEEEKQPGKIVLHSLPNNTTDDELKDLLEGWVPGVSVINVWFVYPKKDQKPKKLLAFVQLDGQPEADSVVEFYNNHRKKLDSYGYLYTNKANITMEFNVTYCYQRQKADKQFVSHGSPQPIVLEDSSDQDSIMNEINVERNSLLSMIQSLEEQLQLRLPDLFVSEMEMMTLRTEEKELLHNTAEKEEQLGIAKSELQELQEVKETYDNLSDEG